MEIYKHFDEIHNYHYKHNGKTIFEINAYKYPYEKVIFKIVEDLSDENDEDIKSIIDENKRILEEKLEIYIRTKLKSI